MKKRKHIDIGKKTKKNVIKSINHLAPKEEISWEAAEFYYYPKNRFWIMGIGVLFLGLIFLFIAVAQYFHYQMEIADYLFLIALGLMIVLFGKYGHIEPKKYAAELRQTGILNKGRLYSYDDFKSFWIIEEPNPTMFLEPVKMGRPVEILLEEEDVDEIRSYLLRYLPEHPTATEHVVDKLNHFLRF